MVTGWDLDDERRSRSLKTQRAARNGRRLSFSPTKNLFNGIRPHRVKREKIKKDEMRP